MTTASQLADRLHVDEGDVRYVVSTLADLHDDNIPHDLVTAVHTILNPNRERTVPELYGYAVEDL